MNKKFKCKNCDSVSTAECINETTINRCCYNRQQRRSYIPIEKTKKTDPKWYRCPMCRSNIKRIGFEEVEED